MGHERVYTNSIDVYAGLRRLGVVKSDGRIKENAPLIMVEEVETGLAGVGFFEAVESRGVLLQDAQTPIQFPVKLEVFSSPEEPLN